MKIEKFFKREYKAHQSCLKNNFIPGHLMNLSEKTFSGMDFSGMNFTLATCYGTEFVDCKFDATSLQIANMHNASFTNCTFSETIFYGTNLAGCTFKDCTIDSLTFFKTNLTGATFKNCKLPLFGEKVSVLDASFQDCEFENENSIPQIVPASGSFIGWKKAFYHVKDEDGDICNVACILKLEITENAKRVSSTGRKCRCSEVKVLDILDFDGDSVEGVDTAYSGYDCFFEYPLGKTVDTFLNEDKGIECTRGIHFFLSFDEAVEY